MGKLIIEVKVIDHLIENLTLRAELQKAIGDLKKTDGARGYRQGYVDGLKDAINKINQYVRECERMEKNEL